MTTYAWVVTRDHLDECDVVVVGPSSAPGALIMQLEAGEGTEFRIYDDDEELYYSGRIIGDHDGFEPLDDYGLPNAGATDIRYLNTETQAWESL